ncbi:nucleoside phosphatase family-domain-containing protein [Hysterangium stoloniferum]|nr:nucleoside phosphatase family-domain-containing protein [Hysterangium stoloniferum]
MRNNNTHALSILPRIGNNSHNHNHTYERVGVDVGQKPAGGMRKRFRWRLVAVGAILLFLFVLVFGPRERRERMLDFMSPTGHHLDDDLTRPPRPDTKLPAKPISNPDAKLQTNPHPTPDTKPLTFQTDPDPSKTTHCTTPHFPDTPLVQWALMIDAGSQGSRIHIYKFHNCRAHPEYEYEVFKMTKPGSGLSKFADNPEEAARSLDVLMDEAMKTVPEKMKKCTPVAVKATAGLRMLGASKSAEVLAAVKIRLESAYPFPLLKENGVVIMDGKDEGIYAWITANYLLNTIRSSASKKDSTTYAVLELGGASTQIVFEPSFTEPGAKFEEGDHKYRLEFSGRSYVLYQHSYLGYGLMQARKSVHRLLDFLHSREKEAESEHVANPCLAQGTERRVEIDDGVGPARNVTFVGADVGSFEACNRVMQLVMAKHEICHVKPCSFNGVYQPSLLSTFPSGPILLLSYFYDRISPLLPPSTQTLSIDTITALARQTCAGQASWLEHWGSNVDVMEELEGRPEYCLDLTFMHALLTVGYEFGGEREVRIAKQVEGTEMGWCLGATIVMLDRTKLVCEV